MASVDVLKKATSVFDNVTRSLKRFERNQDLEANDLKATTKCLYDFLKEQSDRNTPALPELVTEGFDEEQIWQQLELQNESELKHFSSKVSEISAGSKKLVMPVSSTKPELESMQIENESLSQDHEDISYSKELEDQDVKRKGILKKRKSNIRKRKKSSIVDDKFFKLQELDEYLTKEERKERQGEDTKSDDESVDLFNDFSEAEDDNSSQKKYFKYADFFDSPLSEDNQSNEDQDSENGDIEDSEEEGSNDRDEETNDDWSEEDEEEQEFLSKKVRFNLTNDSDETDSLENKAQLRKEDKEEEDKDDPKPKSSLEARRERLLMRIKELEQEAIAEKPWQLKGEVSGPNRPQNSLMEEFVQFDMTSRPAPMITEETNIKLEDIIMQRIKDKAWDDVEKKFKPVETPLEYKKKLVMNQEKSKESLSQIYENEYLKQKQALKSEENEEREEEVPQLHREIKQMMSILTTKLDALSNYHYTPKRVKPEIKIVSNVPAINKEEVGTVAINAATLLAPEEIKAKRRGDLIGKSERTKTDKKRERRRKKTRQRAKQQEIEKREKLNALKPGIAKKHKKEKAAMLKKLTKDRNITKSDETTSKIVKSSTAFFTQLQNQVKSQIKAKARTVPKKKDKSAVSAVKLKL